MFYVWTNKEAMKSLTNFEHGSARILISKFASVVFPWSSIRKKNISWTNAMSKLRWRM